MIWGRRSARTPVLATAGALFFVVCVLPPVLMLVRSLGDGASPATLDAFALDARQRELLVNSTLLAGGTAIVATLIGGPLGVALARVPIPNKALVRVVLAAPLVLPPYLVGLAWVYLSGTRGLIADIIGTDLASGWTYSLPGAVIVLSLVFYPLSMLATEVAMRGLDGRLEEAALIVTSPGRAFRRITLPLAAPAVLAAALVIFVLALSEFGVPALLRVRVYTGEVFTAFAALYDFKRAALLMWPLLFLSTLTAASAGLFAGGRLWNARRQPGVPPLSLEHWRLPAAGAVVATIAFALLLPLAILIGEARNVRSLSNVLRGSGDAVVNSLVLATAGATVTVALGVWIAYWRGRTGRESGRLADVSLLVLFALPSTAVGVGLIALWNRPGPLGAVYGTSGMILLAYLARLLPVVALILAPGVRLVPPAQEEAAAVSGAAWLRTMWHIVLPQMIPALGVAWVVAFVLAFGELGATILVAPPGDATLPIRIYTMIANAPAAQVAALALLQAAVLLAPLALLGLGVSLRARP